MLSAVFVVALGALLGAGGLAPVHAGTAFPQLTLEKLVQDVEADVAPGPDVLVPGTVTFTYKVGLLGLPGPGDLISNVVVGDDNGTPDPADDFFPLFVGGDTGANGGSLDPGETWIFSATRAALLGVHKNTGRVDGTIVTRRRNSQSSWQR